MGTRSLVNIYGGKKDRSELLATVYRQYDGYPTGRGADLKQILNDGDVTITNGISGQKDPAKPRMPASFNGMGELAPYLIGQEKKDQDGNVYMYPPGSTDVGEEYIYSIYQEGEAKGFMNANSTEPDPVVMIEVFSVYDGGKVLYNGPLKDFDPEKAERIGNGEEEAA